jgi:predicted homoserine dehydrogenase-like protein
VLFGDTALSSLGAPTVEVITRAKRDLPVGTVLDGLGGYDTYGEAERADVTAIEQLLPMGVAVGCRLRRALRRDEVVGYSDVDLPAGRVVDALRAEQAAIYPVPLAAGAPAC